MYMDAIIAGFGGQGIMLIGNLLAYAAMSEGRNATFIPVYGPEMRGGTANCTVVISAEEIGSPLIPTPKSLIAMNRPSLEKFQPRVAAGGVVVVNSSLVDEGLLEARRLQGVCVPANEMADAIGSVKMANMVALGAYIHATGVVTLGSAQGALEHVISSHYSHMIPKNAEALAAGYEHVTTQVAAL